MADAIRSVPATRRLSRSCCLPEPARRSAHGWRPTTSRSPPAPAPSACTARATKSAQSRSHRPHGPALLHGSTSAAANPARCGPASAEALTISGIVQLVLAVGADAKLPGLRPHRLRHTYATRLREGGADVAQVQALLGHASLDTSARYFRAGTAEQAAVVDSVFE
ncbi:site-specific integrase [Microbispora bryophytorum]|uniref:site-specific integrase n=1 Tax=Microbispora bryophytorum TaxID=1460882 RepID=UPI00340B5304